MTEPVTCERCGAVADADWCDVSTLGEKPGSAYVMGYSACTTAGCVDERGSRTVLPPEQPGQLTRADQIWLRRQHALAEEYGRADRLLREAMTE